jgi:hypothetical protein
MTNRKDTHNRNKKGTMNHCIPKATEKNQRSPVGMANHLTVICYTLFRFKYQNRQNMV